MINTCLKHAHFVRFELNVYRLGHFGHIFGLIAHTRRNPMMPYKRSNYIAYIHLACGVPPSDGHTEKSKNSRDNGRALVSPCYAITYGRFRRPGVGQFWLSFSVGACDTRGLFTVRGLLFTI